eukprot:GHRQ01024414.1.p2 GENE.GHRQ01024414.1~~GHRQ01024414.1.p2  ORF type:complete len:138 (-),score=31.50 GHRQ01024414.1:674-1087(-)
MAACTPGWQQELKRMAAVLCHCRFRHHSYPYQLGVCRRVSLGCLPDCVPRGCWCRFQRGLKRKPLALIKKLRKAKKDAAAGEKPEAVRTHLRNMIVVPEMIGSVIGVYNGKTFNQVRCRDAARGQATSHDGMGCSGC